MRCFGVGDVADVRIDSREHMDLRVEASMRGKRSQLLHTEQDVEALVEALLEEQLQAGRRRVGSYSCSCWRRGSRSPVNL